MLERYRRLGEFAPAIAGPTVALLIAHEEALAAFALAALGSQPDPTAPVLEIIDALRHAAHVG